MTPERWERVGRLYAAALEVPAEERAGFLDRSCGSDLALRREVESLLAAEGEAEAFSRQARCRMRRSCSLRKRALNS